MYNLQPLIKFYTAPEINKNTIKSEYFQISLYECGGNDSESRR